MIIHYDQGRFIATCAFEQRQIAKSAGFRWDPAGKQWWTSDAKVAARLIEYANAECAAMLNHAAKEREATLAASHATNAEGPLPAPDGLEYMPFQRAGIHFASSRPATLIADEMGLGKTIQAIGVINADDTIKRVLVICPASLRLNWHREMKRWLVRPFSIGIATNQFWPATEIVIIGWDSVAKLRQTIDHGTWDLAIVDESHYGKTPTAQRSKAVFGFEGRGRGAARVEGDAGVRARRRIALTGTPITNRPIEIHPILRWLDNSSWPSFFTFGKRYAAGFKSRYGWDFSGASSLDELQDRLRSSLMIRRLKSEVLTELPAKRRQVIEVPANGAQAVVDAENAAWEASEDAIAELRARVELAKASDDPAEYEAAVHALQEAVQAAFNEMSRLRHATAIAKAPHVAQHIVDVLEGGVAKVVVMAWHHDVVESLRTALEKFLPVVLTGETPMVKRQEAVDRFQQDPDCRVFIGSITAAGVGLTLTAAAHVIFAELDWVPGNITQAEDRCHRIGQANSVLVQHLVLEGSLDARMVRILVEKQRVIDKALDVDTVGLYVAKEEPATAAISRERVAEEAVDLTTRQVAAIHEGLRIVARHCDGAHSEDGAGFSKIDTHIGKSLARSPGLSHKQAALGKRLVTKYRRQVPDEILEVVNG